MVSRLVSTAFSALGRDNIDIQVQSNSYSETQWDQSSWQQLPKSAGNRVTMEFTTKS